MKTTERKRLERKDKRGLIAEIDELQLTVRGMLVQQREGADPADPPFYWMIGYFGWGSAEDDVDFLSGDEYSTPQAAVDAWELLREKGDTRAHDEDNYNRNPRLLVYRIDEIGNATTDRRWVFKPSS